MKKFKFYLKGTSFLWLPIIGCQIAAIITDISNIDYKKMLFCFILPVAIISILILIDEMIKTIKVMQKVVKATLNRSKFKSGNHYLVNHY